MRKLVIAFTIIVAMVSLFISGCAQPATPSPSPAPTTPTPAPAKPIELVFSTWTPEIGSETDICKGYIKEVEAATKGKVTFKLYTAGALGKSADHYKMAQDGIVDISFYVLSINQGQLPINEAFEMPFIASSSLIGSQIYSQCYKDFPELQKEMSAVKIIGLGTNTPYYPMTVEKAGAIKTLEDWKGKKMRSSGLESKTISALGAAPTGMSTAELYLALQKGVIDGTSSSGSAIISFKLNEVCRYYTVWKGSSLRVSPWVLAMNLKKFNSLPPDVQKIMAVDFGADGPWFAKWSGAIWDKYAAQGWEEAKKSGGEFFSLPADEEARWMQKVLPVRDEVVKDLETKGLPGKKLLDRMIELSKEYSK